MNSAAKRRLGTGMRIAVCLAAISWIVWHTQWSQLQEVLSTADWRLALLSVAAFGPAPVLISLRLKWLLEVHDIRLSTWEALKVTFAGNFIINSLPLGTSGGDAVKAYYIARDTPQKHEAVISVFFDRVVGTASLLLMSGLIVLLNWHKPEFSTYGRPIGLAVLVLTTGASVYFSGRVRKLLHLEELVSRLPLAHHVQRLDRALLAFRHRGWRLTGCLAMTVLLQIASIFSLFLAGWALGLVGGQDNAFSVLPVYLAYTPICFLAGALPLGVMEELYVQLFVNAAGLGSREAAVFLSLFSRFIQLVWALPGALVVIKAGRPKGFADLDPESPGQ